MKKDELRREHIRHQDMTTTAAMANGERVGEEKRLLANIVHVNETGAAELNKADAEIKATRQARREAEMSVMDAQKLLADMRTTVCVLCACVVLCIFCYVYVLHVYHVYIIYHVYVLIL